MKKMKKILVTGGSGFIGSNFIHHILTKENYSIINLDALTYAGNELNNEKILKFIPKDQAIEAFRSFFILEDKLFLQKIKNHEYYVDDDLEGSFYNANFLKKVKNDKAIGTSYISINQNYIFLAQENGLFFKINKEDLALSEDFIEVNHIRSNIFNLIRYYDFYGQGQYGIKGFLVDEENIYVAFSNQVSDECFNVSILKAPLNLEYLNFEKSVSYTHLTLPTTYHV